ncbi:hypothetical protein LZ30DRAFT_141250 [Colletotrichum cereale]|nr:hypothetical protein LZ30DRAFT_141250 [Colletotrichum cereale]
MDGHSEREREIACESRENPKVGRIEDDSAHAHYNLFLFFFRLVQVCFTFHLIHPISSLVCPVHPSLWPLMYPLMLPCSRYFTYGNIPCISPTRRIATTGCRQSGRYILPREFYQRLFSCMIQRLPVPHSHALPSLLIYFTFAQGTDSSHHPISCHAHASSFPRVYIPAALRRTQRRAP